MMCDLLRKKMKNAHFTLRVKAKVELKSSIPIGVIIEIIPKGFTLGVKEKKILGCNLCFFMVI